MALPTLVLLPGLDGTGGLFAPLLNVMPAGVIRRVISYPPSERLSYDALLGLIEGQLREEPGVVLVAESFSGPLALRYASEHLGRVRAVVLCASFVRSPAPRWLAWFVRAPLFRLPLPDIVLRRFMAGPGAPKSLVSAACACIRE